MRAFAFLLLAGHASAAGFDPVAVAPYFPDGEPARHLRLEEWAPAADGFCALSADKKAPHPLQAAFLCAWATAKAGRHADAAARFDALVTRYPLLVDQHRLGAARSYLALGKLDEALARATQIPTTSALDAEARLLRADCHTKAQRFAEAATELQAWLDTYPSGWRAPEVRLRLAEALEKTGKLDDARALFRRVYLETPDSWGKRAEPHLVDEKARAFDAPDLATRATAFFDSMRNKESEAEWQKVLGAPKLTPQLTCVARYNLAQSVFKQRDRTRAAPLFDASFAACAEAKDEDLVVKSLYNGARSWGTKGDKDIPATKKAVTLFEQIWRDHPTHSYADDAQLRAAELLDSLSQKDAEAGAKATTLLSSLPTAFSSGDQRGEAWWRLAFRAFKKGDLDGADSWLQAELKALPREEGWWEAGRTLYWLGRVAARRNDPKTALQRYTEAVEQYPLSYYALAALNRIRLDDPAAYAALLTKLVAEPKPTLGWHFADRPLFATAGFQRGVELARLGLGAEAKRELVSAGIALPKGKTLAADADADLLWLVSVIYARAGEPGLSHHIPRYLITDWARELPVGANKKKWLLAFPRGYRDLIEKHAGLNGQPAALEFAIVREESAFDPLLESFANAVGLTQLTAPPAERFANGLPHDRQALRDPTINVTIGARELGALYQLFKQNPALAIAGYNAGEGAVRRWLRDPDRATLALDEWIESIPYDETRGYTKRVLGSYLAYRWLEDPKDNADRVPSLSFELPKR